MNQDLSLLQKIVESARSGADACSQLADRCEDDGMCRELRTQRELFRMIEDRVSLDLLARLISTQLITRGEKHLLDHNRTYYRLLRSIIVDGQRKGELSTDSSVNEIVKTYALCERALMYDWCLCGGDYSLADYSKKMLPVFLSAYRAKD